MTDGYGRKIEYLRISVTDACNLRCTYCMPENGMKSCPCKSAMSADEFIEIATAAAELGMRKLRITGGEPLVRGDILELTRALGGIKGVEDISMTTNATLLAPVAEDLYKAGIHRINISLDTLDPIKYEQITRGGRLTSALEGLRAAIYAGMEPVKINTVLIGGFNDMEIGLLAELTVAYPIELRFIELMPIGDTGVFTASAYIPNSTVLQRLPGLVPVESEPHSVARLYKMPHAQGRIGLISPLSNHFCAECNRLRLTADGCLKPCLHSAEEIPVRGLHGDALKAAILTAVCHKRQRSMSRIGG